MYTIYIVILHTNYTKRSESCFISRRM